jgi:hypothetical protein
MVGIAFAKGRAMNLSKRNVLLVSLGASAVALTAFTSGPANATPDGLTVNIIAHTDFTMPEAPFEANLPGCTTGTVVNGANKAQFTPKGGIFVGIKSFSCAGGAAGFDVRLKARFSADGSNGSWVVTDSWGDLAGMKGSGSLVGFPVSDNAIDDVYSGSVR